MAEQQSDLDQFESQLCKAISDQRLGAYLDALPASGLSDAHSEIRDKTRNTLTNIRAQVDAARLEMQQALADASLNVATPDDTPSDPQYQSFSLEVAPNDLPHVIRVAARLGYPMAAMFSEGAARSLARMDSEITLMRDGDHPMRMRLVWGSKAAPKGRLTPQLEDYAFARLPAQFWWAYPVLKPIRKLITNFGGGAGDHVLAQVSKMSLATPPELLDALFRFADLSAQDVFLDVGCGDGRVLINAVQRSGCRAVGYEINAVLAQQAKDRAAKAGLGGKITIHARAAQPQELADITLAYLFHPPAASRELTGWILKHRAAQTRVLVHEQAGIAFDTPPDRVAPLFAQTALTIARLWNKQENR